MNEYVAVLRKYVAENPPIYGSDAYSILDMLYYRYSECSRLDNSEIKTAFRMLEENTYTVDCAVSPDDFCDQFDMECNSESVSLGGWIMEQMGRIPDCFTYRNLCITATKLNDHRIESAQIKVLEPETVKEN